MRLATITLTLTLATSAFAGPVEEVADAEIAFAKAFADRDAAKFFAMVAPDATFIGGLRTMRGKDAVVKGWTRLLEGPQAPFSWGPERVEVTADGKLGLSTGPIYDPKGVHAGDYSSIWQKQGDGSWKVIFDGPGSAPAEVGKVEEGFVNADDGTKLYYRKFGSGPITMIVPLDYFLHEQFKQFANIATVVTYDNRNRGRSQRAKDESSWTIQQDVRDLEAVRRELKIEKFVPVGFSYLGLMVAIYALDHPDRVTRVVQLDPVPFHKVFNSPSPEEGHLGVPAADMTRLEELTAAGALEKSPREFCEARFNVSKYVLVGRPANAAKLDAAFCALENEWPVNFYRHLEKHFASVREIDLTARLKDLKVPVLTIHGDKDRNAPYFGGAEWVKSLPDARLVTVNGAAHAAWLDDPVTVFGSIRHFLRGEWPLGSTAAP
jgi:pimeloyl-ACP methyl ester carboxylesterase/ketosteroid isomerase-like protein